MFPQYATTQAAAAAGVNATGPITPDTLTFIAQKPAGLIDMLYADRVVRSRYDLFRISGPSYRGSI